MKWNVYKKLTVQEKEEYNFKFAPDTRPLLAHSATTVWLVMYLFTFFFLMLLSFFVILNSSENPDVVSPEMKNVLVIAYDNIIWLSKITIWALISATIMDGLRIGRKWWKEVKFLRNTQFKKAERKKEERRLKRKLNKKVLSSKNTNWF